MSNITTGVMAKDLLPGVKTWFGAAYNAVPNQYEGVFKTEKSTRNFEEDVAYSTVGLAKQKAEGAKIEYDSARQLYTARYLNIAYALGMSISREMRDDGQTLKIANKLATELGRTTAQTKNVVAANILNRAFNSSYVGGDSKELCATDHSTTSGTMRNELTTGAVLSQTSLEQALIDIRDIRDDRNLRAFLRPKKLVVPTELVYTAERLMASTLQSGTADNDINAVRSTSSIPDGVMVMDYLTDTNNWFITTDCPDGLKHMERVAPEVKTDNDFETDDMKFKIYFRCAFGWSDPRGIFGSEAA